MKIKKILISLAVSLVIFFVFLEITMRLYTSFNTFYDIEMTRYANEVKIDAGDPKIGHLHRPHAKAHLMNVSVEINSDGFRDQNYPVARNKKKRWIFLGDSLTFGWGVKREETFEYVLEKKLDAVSPTEVINFGTGNYNTEQQVHLFLKKGLKYKPDNIVIFYFINDAEQTPKRSKWQPLSSVRSVTFLWSRFRGLLTNTGTRTYKEFYSNLYKDDHIGWQNTKKAFLKIKKACSENSIGLRVILLPELHNLEKYTFAKEHKKILDFLQKNDIKCKDLAPSFAKEKNPFRLWVAPDDAHPNGIAQKLIAEYSLDFILGKLDNVKKN